MKLINFLLKIFTLTLILILFFQFGGLVIAEDEVVVINFPRAIPIVPETNSQKYPHISGFLTLDPMTPEEEKFSNPELVSNAELLPRYLGKFDFENARKQFEKELKEEKLPWIDQSLGYSRIDPSIDLTNKDSALNFAVMMQKYIYEGWFTNNKGNNESRPDWYFHPNRNKHRYWCTMPWMNPGSSGRDAIHGLTKEFPMGPSHAFPVTFDLFKSFRKRKASWGTAYFNSVACQTFEGVFEENKNDGFNEPKWRAEENKIYKKGFVSFKLLFNSMNEKQAETIGVHNGKEGALRWRAHVSDRFVRQSDSNKLIPASHRILRDEGN